jgi:superfamily I DNA/RNA helicase
VDEFQDTDDVQFRMLRQVADGGTLRVREVRPPAGCHLFCVADDDQSIYRFRSARPRNLHEYVDAYGCTREAGTRHVLTTNYRSNRAIYAVAESVLDTEGRLKRRGEIRTQDAGTRPVTLTRYDDEPAEVDGAVAQVRAWTEEAGIPRDAVAVLAPWNSRVEELEDAFLRAGIPCETSGGRALMETRPVRRLRAVFRLVDGLLEVSTRGLAVCDDALADLLALELDDETGARVLDLWRGLDEAPLWAVFQRPAGAQAEAEARGLSAADHARLAQLYATLGNLAQTARQPGQTVGGLADASCAARRRAPSPTRSPAPASPAPRCASGRGRANAGGSSSSTPPRPPGRRRAAFSSGAPSSCTPCAPTRQTRTRASRGPTTRASGADRAGRQRAGSADRATGR